MIAKGANRHKLRSLCKTAFLSALFAAAVSGPSAVFSQEPPAAPAFASPQASEPEPAAYPALRNGLRYYDVIKLWGTPDSKQGDNSSSQEVWIYGEGKVYFQRGKVVAWIVPPGVMRPHSESGMQQKALPPQPATDESPEVANRKMQELLGEIMQDLPK